MSSEFEKQKSFKELIEEMKDIRLELEADFILFLEVLESIKAELGKKGKD